MDHSCLAPKLKVLIDDTRTTLVVAGLPSCRLVIDENEQLARRFSAAIELPRFNWQAPTQRKEFKGIVSSFDAELRKGYDLPELHSDEMLRHLYGASGGLVGYLVKILVQTVRTAEVANRRIVRLADITDAYKRALWSRQWPQGTPAPFDSKFCLDDAALKIVGTVGKPVEAESTAPKRVGCGRKEASPDSMLSLS